MSRTKSNHSKQSNINYQALYLWTSFLLGMISLGIVAWNRRQTSFNFSTAIPAQVETQENFVIPNTMKNLIPSGFMEIPHFTRDDSFRFASSFVLSALTYSQTSSSFVSLIVGLSSYLNTAVAQPALTVNLDALNSRQGVIFDGASYTGVSVYAKDVNNDSYVDLLIGAYGPGLTYLVYGPNFASATALGSLGTQKGVTFSGTLYTGFPVYAADVNKDGHVDVFIGSFMASKAYLIYGPNFANATSLDSLTSQQGVIFTGSGYAGYSFYVADVNKDGHQDILIGTYYSNVYLVYGPNFANAANLDSLNGITGVIFSGSSGTGSSVYAADLNNDSNLDILIGALGSGKAYLVYGPNFANATSLDLLNGQKGVVFYGATNVGSSIIAKDVNNDTYLDILIGAYDAGKFYLVYGPNFGNAAVLDALSGQRGVVFVGGGHYIDAGDMNNDGYVDIVAGAWTTSKIYLIYGPNFANATMLENLNLQQGVIFNGGSYTGISVYVTDVNGDGCLDILAGAHHASRAYLIFNQAFATCLPKTTLAPTTTASITKLTTVSSSVSSTTLIKSPMTIPATTSSIASLNSDSTSTTTVSASVSLQSMSQSSFAAFTSSFSLTAETTTTTQIPAEKTSGSGNSTAAIAGGAAGGVIVLGGAIAACAFWRKKNKKENELDTNTNDKKNVSLNSIPRSSEYASFQQDHVNSARTQYAKIDESKKTENEYDRPAKLEI